MEPLVAAAKTPAPLAGLKVGLEPPVLPRRKRKGKWKRVERKPKPLKHRVSNATIVANSSRAPNLLRCMP